MQIYYDFSQDLNDLELLLIAEKNGQVYKSILPMDRKISFKDLKSLVDWVNQCMKDVEAL